LREGRFSSAAAQEAHWTPHEPGKITLGEFSIPLDWPVKGEPAKMFVLRLINGFFSKYMSGSVILDIGYRGGHTDAVPIFPHAIGIDLDYPGYDGVRLPFEDGSVDSVFASHILEHVLDPTAVFREWFRVLKIGGFIVCIVPHQYLYERKVDLPSRWNAGHLRFYTPAALLRELEESLEPNSYRIRCFTENDFGYAYGLTPDRHAWGCYEIELVVEKIERPSWTLC
jgi:SAM-dependent methyltransferase